MNRLRYILQHRYYVIVFSIIFLIGIFIYTKVVIKKSMYNGSETEFKGIVYKIKKHDTYTSIYLKTPEKLIVNYENVSDYIKLGDTIKVEGALLVPNNNTIPNIFNYKKYLYNHQIYYIVKAKNIKKLKNNVSIIYAIRDKISNRIDRLCKNSYLSIFILGDNSYLSEDIIESYQKNGISHLFSISGMHISLFATLILYIMKRLSYNDYLNYGIVLLFLIFYSLLVGSTPSVVRTVIMYFIMVMCKLFNIKMNNLNKVLLVLVVSLSINPFYLYDMAFQYSYLISSTLVLISKKIGNIKNKLIKSLYISFISFMVSLPICIYNFYQVNFLSIILNIIFIPLVSIIIFPLALISYIVYPLVNILNLFTKLLEYISLSLPSMFIVSFIKPSILFIIVYYLLLAIFIINYKHIYIFILLSLLKVSPYLSNNLEVYYLDVGQGDSVLINYPYNKYNILIDTGGSYMSSYSKVINSVVLFFKSKDINKIDYLILSHGDYDHMGESINLINNFKVDNVVFNCGDYNDLESELIKVLDRKKIKYYKCINELYTSEYKLKFLNTRIYDNENDNSNVIYLNYEGYKFLFMGDSGIDKENDILNKYNLKNIDFLKVGHHGSNTSSSKFFISKINSKYSLISVGKNNRYGHPKQEVLDTLKNSKIYRTDIDGSIEIKLNKSGYKIRTCPP